VRLKVIFDVDGVLIDGWHADSARRKPWDATLEADLGVKREAFQEAFFGLVGGQSESLMSECVSGRRDTRDALAAILPRLGYQGQVDHFMRYWFEKDSNLNARVLELVDQLRESDDADVYIATGQEHYRAQYLWNELGFRNRFDGMFYSAQIGWPKADARFFESINRNLGITPRDRPIFFDDQSSIVELARSAGWDASTFTCPQDIVEHPRLAGLLAPAL
jgi:putative hydrolase of the HAD superfamily